MSTSPSRLGGLRGLAHLRSVLENIFVTVMPHQITIPYSDQAFDDNDNLVKEQHQQNIENLGKKLADILKAVSTIEY